MDKKDKLEHEVQEWFNQIEIDLTKRRAIQIKNLSNQQNEQQFENYELVSS